MENIYNFDPACSQHSALTALRLLRSYNHFVVPPDESSMNVRSLLNSVIHCPSSLPTPSRGARDGTTVDSAATTMSARLLSPPTTGFATIRCRVHRQREFAPLRGDATQGEKRPIPTELKDEKYFERRRRNNQAAKKSRDARRMREDQIAWRACVLEQENASLRAHVAALTQETRALRALLARDEAPTSTTD